MELTSEDIQVLNALRSRARELHKSYNKGCISTREYYPVVAALMSEAKCIIFYPDDVNETGIVVSDKIVPVNEE